MKKLLFILIFGQSLWQSISAQNSSVFEVYPNPSDTVISLETEFSTAFAQIKNISTDSIFVKWVRSVINISPGVDNAVCDPEQCWFITTQTNSFGLAPDSVGKLYVSFSHPGNQAASGIVHLKLTNLGNAADTLTAVYTFSKLSGTNDPPKANVKLFPNPTTDFFTLEKAEDVASMRIFALDGRIMARFDVSPDNTYSIGHLPVGNYVLSFEDKNGQLFQAVEINKR